MTQFKIQFYKDFRSYFSHLNAYILLGCYCFLSFALTLYLGNYFLRETNAINSYLSLQPFVLMLLIPSLTMRTWTDEIKSGTIELLLTQPISYTTLVLAKFCAAFAFFNLMVLCSIPLLLVTSSLSLTDWGTVLLGYVGLWLCGLFFTALGCVISACHRNNIICYLSTILIIFIVTELKFTPLTIGYTVFPLDYLCFLFHYNSFLSGIFYWGNVLYFILATLLCLWLNVVLVSSQRRMSVDSKMKLVTFVLLLLGIFLFSITGFGYTFTHSIDVTHTKKYTLSAESIQFLEKNEQRINIVLYESTEKRKDIYSGYALYAEYVERFLNLIEYTSHGSIRAEVVHVEPFSNQERTLVRRLVPYTEDSFGHKIFMAADFTDNDGNFATINAFNPLRQDLLEADIMRILRRFTLPKKNVAVIAPTKDWNEMNGFKNYLNEFYQLTYLQKAVTFIPQIYSAVFVINYPEFSDEFLLAMEQYILNGGTLLIFYDAEANTVDNSLILQKFVTNYGIKPLFDEPLIYQKDKQNYIFGPAHPTKNFPYSGIRSVLLNNVGPIEILSTETSAFRVFPLLTFSQNVVATKSHGHFVSDYLHLAATESSIEAISQKDGSLFFFNDTDLLKDYLYLSEESKQSGFYENVPTADNLLFIFRLLDYALQENIESVISYKHSPLGISSIGQSILRSVKDSYREKIEYLEQQIKKFEHQQNQIGQNISLHGQVFAKNLGDSYNSVQSLEEAQDELGQIYTTIFNEYELFITSLSLFLVIIIPISSLLLLALLLFICKKRKFHRIRRLISNA